MPLPFAQHFDACLPDLKRPVRITSLYDAQVFTRRWVIRDKNRALRALLRRLERADNSAAAYAAIGEFKQALRAHGLFPEKSGQEQ